MTPIGNEGFVNLNQYRSSHPELKSSTPKIETAVSQSADAEALYNPETNEVRVYNYKSFSLYGTQGDDKVSMTNCSNAFINTFGGKDSVKADNIKGAEICFHGGGSRLDVSGKTNGLKLHGNNYADEGNTYNLGDVSNSEIYGTNKSDTVSMRNANNVTTNTFTGKDSISTGSANGSSFITWGSGSIITTSSTRNTHIEMAGSNNTVSVNGGFNNSTLKTKEGSDESNMGNTYNIESATKSDIYGTTKDDDVTIKSSDDSFVNTYTGEDNVRITTK